MIYVIDDDEVMGECIAKACGGAEVRIFTNAMKAMEAISDGVVPDLVFLDILLDGPDGFTFLNEMVSYDDTAKVPVAVVTSLDLAGLDLTAYGVVGVLSKETMRPEEILGYVKQYA
ncbi:response regulator [Candidatus Saccharibacteria bacterium]|nr:response regulator [Candidatus Saccharibacteria bacterium]